MKKMYVFLTIVVLVCLSLILAIDRVRLNYRLSTIDTEINKQLSQWSLRQRESDEKLAKREAEIERLEQRFHVVGDVSELQNLDVAHLRQQEEKASLAKKDETSDGVAEDAGQQDKTLADVSCLFPRKCMKKGDLEMAETLAKSVKTASPSEVQRVFKQYLDQPEKAPSKLYINEECNVVMDQDAAILTELCALLGLRTETTVYWYMRNANMPRSFATRVFVPEGVKDEKSGKLSPRSGKENRPITIKYGNAENIGGKRESVAQNRRFSTVLPLSTVFFRDAKMQSLKQDVHEIPAGGLYILRINVNLDAKLKSNKWMLEIVYPQRPEPYSPYRLEALPLIPNTSIKSSAVANRQSFLVTVDARGNSELLLLGDYVCIPESIVAYPIEPGK